MNYLWQWVWPPGLWANADVRTAFVIGTSVAIAGAVVGVFVIIRGQAFSGHALGDVGSTGAAGAYLTGISALWGFLAAGFSSGIAMESLGDRVRERDIATGVVLAFMLGLSALLLYFISTSTGTAGAPIAILFGSLFTVNPAVTPEVVALTVLALLIVGVIYRPLLFSSVMPEVARVRGVSARVLGLVFMVALVIAVEESALVIGALLSTALLVGPAASATLVARRPTSAMGIAVLIALGQMWLGIILAYDSFSWPPVDRGWPVSFFITSLVLLTYLAMHSATGILRHLRARASARVDHQVSLGSS